MFAPRNSSEKVPMYSSSNYSLSLCDYVSDEVSEKRKHQKQKIYDFSHNNIFEAINANDMAALGYKLRYDRATLEIYHFTRSLSRLKTNSKICQLFRRLIQLKIYIFLTARWFRNKIIFSRACSLIIVINKKGFHRKKWTRLGTIAIVLKTPKRVDDEKRNIKQLSDFSMWMKRGRKKIQLSSFLTRFRRFLLNKKMF